MRKDKGRQRRGAGSNTRAALACTALALGLIGEPSAANVLIPMLADPNPAVRLQVAEALWRLGREDG